MLPRLSLIRHCRYISRCLMVIGLLFCGSLQAGIQECNDNVLDLYFSSAEVLLVESLGVKVIYDDIDEFFDGETKTQKKMNKIYRDFIHSDTHIDFLIKKAYKGTSDALSIRRLEIFPSGPKYRLGGNYILFVGGTGFLGEDGVNPCFLADVDNLTYYRYHLSENAGSSFGMFVKSLEMVSSDDKKENGILKEIKTLKIEIKFE